MKLLKPHWQAAFFVVVTIIALIILQTKDAETAWMVAGSGYGAFILLNSILVWKAHNFWRYVFISLGITLMYVAISWMVVTLYSQLKALPEKNEASMIFVIVMYHPMLLGFVKLIQWVTSKITKGKR